MNDNLQELIEKLVYKTTDETGWAPQNKLGQYMARLGRSVRELGYDKMSSYFLDHPDRFLVEKDIHGLPIVRLIGDAPVDHEVPELDMDAAVQQRPQRMPMQPGQQAFRPRPMGGYNDYGYGRPHPAYNRFNPRPYGRPMGMYRERPYKNEFKQLSLFRWAFFPDREEWLQMLADLAEPQIWHYEELDPQHPNPALFDYLRDTFRRLQLEGRVLESRPEGIALFNTGLLDREEKRPIYAVFGPNPNRNRQPWLFQEFFLSSAPLLAAARNDEALAAANDEEEIVEDDEYTGMMPGEEDDDNLNYIVD